MMRIILIISIICALATCVLAGTEENADSFEVTVASEKLCKEFRLDEFYVKAIVVEGFPVVSSAEVSDIALKEAAYLVDKMLTGRGDIRQALIKNRIKFAVIATGEFTTDIPEYRSLKPADYWDRRARGLGATKYRPTVSCGEENLLCAKGDPYRTENILIHEFAHTMHQLGLNYIDKSFEERLKKLYKSAIEKGLWKDTYAGSNFVEYWAEGVQSWFDTNTQNNPVHNHINNRKELIEYDGELAKLIGEVFRDHQWRYVKPYDRAKEGHLKEYDRRKLKRFVWPRRLDEAAKEVRKDTERINGTSKVKK